jgi:hypothetical protein
MPARRGPRKQLSKIVLISQADLDPLIEVALVRDSVGKVKYHTTVHRTLSLPHPRLPVPAPRPIPPGPEATNSRPWPPVDIADLESFELPDIPFEGEQIDFAPTPDLGILGRPWLDPKFGF